MAHNRKRRDRDEPFCKQATSILAEYVTGALDTHATLALESHLSACPDCVAFLNTYKKTIHLTRLFLASPSPQAFDADRCFVNVKPATLKGR